MFSLESPHTIFRIKQKITLNYPKSAAMRFSSKGLKKQFETDVLNEPSVFEPLKFYCKCFSFAYEYGSVYVRKEKMRGIIHGRDDVTVMAS